LDWFRESIIIGNRRQPPTFKEGEIWWCSIGVNIGREIFGKGKKFARPVIIFKKFGKESFLGIPLTTQIKEGSWYVPIIHNGKVQHAILSQIRVFNAKRLIKKSATVESRSFKDLSAIFLTFYSS
jgi:mRNA interferase MazF